MTGPRLGAWGTASVRSLWSVVLLALGACAGGGEEAAFVGPADAEYVGAAACASCHEDISAAYASHGMAQSMAEWTPETRIEPTLGTPLVDASTGFEYRVVEADGRLAQEERQLGADGMEIARLVRPMDVIVGSGDAARTYLARRGDRFVELPLTWYTQGGGRWDWSPGYESGNPRFDRVVPDGCLSCHTGIPERLVGVEDGIVSLPDGIGCERCHGPGSVHVEARLASDRPEGPDPTIVNTAHLPLDLRLDVCSQCHLHATVDVLRDGETAYSYRPGRPLAAHEALFAVPGVEEGAGVAVVSHAARMQASACFQESLESAAPLECVTCHDPHRGFESRPAGAPSAACVTCHEGVGEEVPAGLRAQHLAPTGCVSCHMPRVEAQDAPHSSFTDHWIRVVDGPVREMAPEVGRSGVVSPLAARDRDGAEGGLYEGVAAVTYGIRSGDARAVAQGAQFVTIALDQLGDGFPDARFVLGVALLQAGRAADALAPLAAAAQSATPETAPQRLETLARALADAGRAGDSDAAFRRAIAAQPRRPASHREHGRFLLAQRRPAVEALREAVGLDPYDAEAHLLLGLAQRAAGQSPNDSWRESVRLDPDLAGVLAPVVDGADVFGWPRSAPLAASTPVTAFTTSGTRVAGGPWSEVASRLAPGIAVVSTPAGVRRLAVSP
ncbi:multiheme c-type cytochrome [Rubrivirga sp. IMCC43871]|uniref:cytochrome c3 family protein n=1 Tax=Rubrivirga sp. IMCC43871 TaxID=3391575 RepID=UPI003990252C